MPCSQIINSVGLGFGMIGVVIIFSYGPPQPSLEEGVGLGLQDATKLPDGRTVAEHDADIRRKRSRHSILSKLGLSLIFLGFAFQLGAVWV